MCKEDNQINRRALLSMLLTAGASMALVSGCVSSASNKKKTTAATGDGSSDSTCTEAATETNGPFPADGTNTAGDGNTATLDHVYSGSPIIRSGIDEGMNGIPLNLTITLQNVSNYCSVLSGYYIYIWHCTAEGVYSAYTGTNNGGTHSRTETYMRGIQETDTSGQATFTTIYPGWYNGRAVHIHVEVYRNLDDSLPIKVTQFAFPMGVTRTVVAQTNLGYPGITGLMDNSADNIFSDGTTGQMLSVSGSNTYGYNATIALGIKA